jgi:cysteinyl-tRNA synthetase
MWFFQKKPTEKIFLFNTKGREKQLFEPIKPDVVRIYSCGPTVYDFVHIGNLRSFLLSDIVRRTFEYAEYKVTQVMNITDFGHLVGDADDTEDKMLLGLKREGMAFTMENMFLLASRYVDAFTEDLNAMNIMMPHVMPRASEHVPGMVAYVETLLDKKYAYTTSDGVYFDTEEFPEYGVLGGISTSDEHSRVGVHTEKKNQKDFALWKFNKEMGWDAPWGKGFPGWHIECTAMATRYLGKTLDIHTGGIDHIAVHHNNEIAQAECANNKTFARYWLHNEFITIDAKRIGKSEGNAITLRQLVDRGVNPLAYRYWLLTGHYRSPMNFTWEAVEAAQTAWHRAQKIFLDLESRNTTINRSISAEYKNKFDAALYDDLNTPECIAVLWEMLKDDSVPDDVKKATILRFDRVLGLGFAGARSRIPATKISVMAEMPDEVAKLIHEREEARAQKDFARADTLRERIAEAGYMVEDHSTGPRVSKIPQP